MFTFYFSKFGSSSFVFNHKPQAAPGRRDADTGPEAKPSGALAEGPKPPEPPPDREEELRRQTQAREAAAGEARQGTLDTYTNLRLADIFQDEGAKKRFLENINGLGEKVKQQTGEWITKYKNHFHGGIEFSPDDMIQGAEAFAALYIKDRKTFPLAGELIKAGKLPSDLPQEALDAFGTIVIEYTNAVLVIFEDIKKEEAALAKLDESSKELLEKYAGAIRIEGGKMAIDEMQIPEAERVQIKPQLEALKAKYESLAKAGEQEESGNEGKIAALVAAIMKFFEWLSQKLTETFGSIEKAVAKGKKDAKGGEPRTAQTGSPSEGGKPPENPAEQTVAFLREAIPGLTPDELAALNKFSAQKLAKGQVKKPDNFNEERFKKAIGLLKSNRAEGLTDGDLAVAAFFEGKFQKNEPPSGLAETDKQENIPTTALS